METEFHAWYYGLQVERTVKALQKNSFDARYAGTPREAVAQIFTMIPDGATVGVGGSVTLNQIGFFQEATKRPIKLMNPAGLPIDEMVEARRQMFVTDVYLSGCNAITEDGKLFNIDGSGNRVGAMGFGPKKVILVAGINKIVRDLDEAQKRVRYWTAPMNARRLALKTPCAETGQCADCASPQRICNIFTVMAKRPSRTDVTVLLVGESLGL